MTIKIDGNEISSVTVDGAEVQEVLIDGNVVWSSFPPSSVSDNMDHYYPLAEGSGSTAFDDGGSEDFSINGADWQSGGTQEHHLNLNDANNDYLENTNSSAWDNNSFTAAIWVNPDTDNGHRIIDHASGGGGSSWVIGIGGWEVSSGNVGFAHNDGNSGSNIVIEHNVEMGVWQFVAVSANNGGSATFYYAKATDSDLTEVGSANYDNGLRYSTDRMWMGGQYNGGSFTSFYDGQIDFPMFNMGSALSKSKLEQIFDDTKGSY